jgi:2-keto-4-pentenoate hydratase/2-oxohepta-3-ene-1,7-dioic acid hydratase in catechol pathway
MKLLRYGPAGREKPGLLDAEGNIRDLDAVVDDIAGDALAPEMLAELAMLDVNKLPVVREGVRIGPCVGRVGKFICIGLNFSDHAAEANLPIPSEPVVFGKWTSAIVGPNDDIEIPRGAQKTDWEVELGVVIGRHGRYILESDALSHVAGYCIVHDVSERELQRRYLDCALELFGARRLMFGSDWPVCSLVASYAVTTQIIERWSAKLSSEERDWIFGNTAAHIYEIGSLATDRGSP